MDGLPPLPVYDLLDFLKDVTAGQKDKTSLRTVEGFGQDLYIATSDGKVLQPNLRETEPGHGQGSIPTLQVTATGGKAIDRLILFKQLYKAVILTGGLLSFYSLPNLSPLSTNIFPSFKNVTAIAIDRGYESSENGQGHRRGARLCLMKKRIILLIHVDNQGISNLKEIPLPETALLGQLVGHFLCIADHQYYSMVDLRNARLTPLLPISQIDVVPGSPAPRPLILVIGRHLQSPEFLIVSSTGTSSIGIFVNAQGDPIRGTLEWASHPKAVVLDRDYIVALLKNNTIEIHRVDTQALQQVITVPSDTRGLSHVSNLRIALPTDDEDSLRTLIIDFERSNEGHWTPKALPATHEEPSRGPRSLTTQTLVFSRSQVQCLSLKSEVDQLEFLVELDHLEEAMEVLTKATVEHAQDFRSIELQYMMQLLGLAFLKRRRLEDAISLFLDSRFDIRLLLYTLVPSLTSLQDGQQVQAFENFLSRLQNLSTATKDTDSTDTALLEFLCQLCLAQRARPLNKSSIKQVDNSLVEILALLGRLDAMDQILSEMNSCTADQVKKVLEHTGRHFSLSLLYQREGREREMFSIWRRLLDGQLSDPTSKVSSDSVFVALRHCQDEEIVLEYGLWLCQKDEDLGLELFMSSENLTANLDPVQVLTALRTRNGALARQYTEYLVLEKNIENPSLHSELVIEYLAQLQRMSLDNEIRTQLDRINSGYDEHQDETFISYLCSKIAEDPEKSPLIALRLRLVLYLYRSQYLDTTRISQALNVLDGDGKSFEYERALILARVQKPEAVIKVLADLGDIVSACYFCSTGGEHVLTEHAAQMASASMRGNAGLAQVKTPMGEVRPIVVNGQANSNQPAKRANLFNHLFETLVDSPAGRQVYQQLEHLLNGTSQILSHPDDVLGKIQPAWPLAIFCGYLEHLIRREQSELDMAKIEKALSKQRPFLFVRM